MCVDWSGVRVEGVSGGVVGVVHHYCCVLFVDYLEGECVVVGCVFDPGGWCVQCICRGWCGVWVGCGWCGYFFWCGWGWSWVRCGCWFFVVWVFVDLRRFFYEIMYVIRMSGAKVFGGGGWCGGVGFWGDCPGVRVVGG